MKLLVWLWNPWDKYKNTRHNVWFIILDEICRNFWFSNFIMNNSYNWLVSEWIIFWEKVIALKPMTFMNLSWKSILALSNFYKIAIEDIVLIYDDIDMPLWKIRLRLWWSAWWHNWVKSTIQLLWSDKFYRLKIWIDRPLNKELVTNHVLWNFTSDEISKVYWLYDDMLELIKSTF